MHTPEPLPIFVINLERSPERRQFMRTQLDALGLHAEFFAAVDGATARPEELSRYDENKALWLLGHPLSRSEIGCFASHYQLWERCVAMQKSIVIMEDDVRLEPLFTRALQLAAQKIDDLRFLRLSAMFPRRYQILTTLDDQHALIRYCKGPYGMQCYALSPKGAEILLKHAQVWIDAVDSYVDRFWKHGLASLALYPFHAVSDRSVACHSTIGTDRFSLHRPWHRGLRRNVARFIDRVQRYAFNAFYHPPV